VTINKSVSVNTYTKIAYQITRSQPNGDVTGVTTTMTLFVDEQQAERTANGEFKFTEQAEYVAWGGKYNVSANSGTNFFSGFFASIEVYSKKADAPENVCSDALTICGNAESSNCLSSGYCLTTCDVGQYWSGAECRTCTSCEEGCGYMSEGR
jgi:hypothetical protein